MPACRPADRDDNADGPPVDATPETIRQAKHAAKAVTLDPPLRSHIAIAIPMADPKKTSPVQFIANIESVRLPNLFFRIAWKCTFGLIAFAARLIATIGLRIMRGISRRRVDW
jgi:hypothetical protein